MTAGVACAPATSRKAAERGSGTVLALAVVAVTMCVGLVLAGLGQAQAVRGQAQAAADLAALAGATAARSGGDPCSVARQTADHNGARLDSCTRETHAVVRVSASRPARLIGVIDGTATAQARAGPADARD